MDDLADDEIARAAGQPPHQIDLAPRDRVGDTLRERVGGRGQRRRRFDAADEALDEVYGAELLGQRSFSVRGEHRHHLRAGDHISSSYAARAARAMRANGSDAHLRREDTEVDHEHARADVEIGRRRQRAHVGAAEQP